MSSLLAARVTIRPVLIEISRAGIWLTRPSPTLSKRVGVDRVGDAMCFCTTPIKNPPKRLMKVMTIAAVASPLTNFEAPSIAP